jgi:hypothetical protein
MLLIRLFVEKFFDKKMTNGEMCNLIEDYGVDKFFADLCGMTEIEEYDIIYKAYHYAKKWFDDHS